MARKLKTSTVRKHAIAVSNLEEAAVGLALSRLYNEKTGVTVVSRSTLASLTHYSEKRVRTIIRRMGASGRWNIERVSDITVKSFSPIS